MNQDIHTHLEKLKRELENLEPAVKQLKKADENATALINSFSNIHKEFSKHLNNIENSLAEANNIHHKYITSEIVSSTKKITGAVDLLIRSNSSFDEQIKAFILRYERLATETTKLIEKIDKVDFPSRLDKLDATVSSINQGLQNTQTRIGDLERNLKDDFQAKSRELTSKLVTTENSLQQKIANDNKLLKIMLIVSISLTTAVLVLSLMKL